MAGRGPYPPRGGRGRGDRGGGRGDRGGGGGGFGRGDRGGGGGGYGRGAGDRGGGFRGDLAIRGPRGDGGFRGGRGRGGPVQIFTHDNGQAPQLNQKVARVESEFERQLTPGKGRKPPQTPEGLPVPLRPSYGTKGKAVTLWANYFELIANGHQRLFRYHIDIKMPKKESSLRPRTARRIVELLLEEHFAQYLDHIASDYRSNLVSRGQLDVQEDGYPVTFRFEGEDEPAPDAKTYECVLKETGTLSISELTDYLSSTRASELFGSKEEVIQALNIVVGQYCKADPQVASIGANKHYQLNGSAVESMDLGAGLIAVRGFFISARAATARVLLNVQVKNAAFYQEGRLDQLINVYNAASYNNKYKLEKFLRTLRIKVTHIKRKNKAGDEIDRIKTIIGLARREDGFELPKEQRPRVKDFGAGASDVQFFLKPKGEQAGPSTSSPPKSKKGKKPTPAGPAAPDSGGYITVQNFFQREYGIRLTNPGLSVVNVGTRAKPSYLPADVCVVLPGQPAKSKLTPRQTQSMIRFAVRPPAQNAESIVRDGARILGIKPEKNGVLKEFEVQATARMIAVPGRVLPAPNLTYRNGSANPRFGSWNLQMQGGAREQYKFQPKRNVDSWASLWITMQGKRDRDPWKLNQQAFRATIHAFGDKLRDVGLSVGNQISSQHVELRSSDDTDKLDERLRLVPSTSLLFVILPEVDDKLYNKIKHSCDVKFGIVNVCSVASKLTNPRGQDQYFANVALKINLKLGGRNHTLEDARLGIIAQGKTMLVGLDVTHPSPGSSKSAPSVAGIVASIDKHLSQFPADIRIQKAREEMVLDLDGLMRSRLQLWKRYNNNVLPDNILVYRDGVSEGQFNLVLEKELPLFRKACAAIYPASQFEKGLPRITIIIVGKRHHTRFYPTQASDAAPNGNPQNGTVVDRQVTESRNWDFFLQAHAAIQGTARPAHYSVVHDEIFANNPVPNQFANAADMLQDLTHNLCYLYGRATKAVSICPPAYYADLVCERARRYLSRLFDDTPEATPAPSVLSGGDGRDADPSEVKLHDAVKDTMFYI